MWFSCSYCSAYCISLRRHVPIPQAHTQCSVTEHVCERGVTECLNYGLIVSLAGFCCCHHIGPVKVNYWNMFICCQPLPQAVTCMETQTNTHRRCSLKQLTGHLVSLNSYLSSFVSASAHFVQLSVGHLKYKHTVILRFPSIQSSLDTSKSLMFQSVLVDRPKLYCMWLFGRGWRVFLNCQPAIICIYLLSNTSLLMILCNSPTGYFFQCCLCLTLCGPTKKNTFLFTISFVQQLIL